MTKLQPRWLIAFITAFIAIIVATWHPAKVDEVQRNLQQHNATNNSNSLQDIPNTTTTGNHQEIEEECSCSKGNVVDNEEGPLFASSTSLLFGLEGNVSDCCCSFTDIEKTNLEIVHPLLDRIVKTPFFAHFKIDLCSTCQLWDDSPLCILRDCSVCECEEPPSWANVDWMPKHSGPSPTTDDDGDDCGHLDDRVVTTVNHHITEDWTASPSSFLDTISTSSEIQQQKDDGPTSENNNAVVVDLRLNPERYTGYSGQSAEKVWNAIHSENCFQPENSSDNNNTTSTTTEADRYCALTPEQRVYNRIISGMHSSISLHIAHSYCLEVDPEHSWECKRWGVNTALAHDRVLDYNDHHPDDRLENLYVAFAMVLRAVQKAGPAVTAAVPTEDEFFSESLTEWTDSLLPELTRLAQTCPLTFDESSLCAGGDNYSKTKRRLELQRRFRQLQQIMECVGCDRCKLWGTLQTLGVGTALRVLLHDDGDEETLNLSRQEAVALVHTLERFSKSLVYAEEFKKEAQLHL